MKKYPVLSTQYSIRTALSSRIVRRRLSSSGLLLTFDDGPDPDVTPAVLDRLRTFGARAIFFVVGRRIGRAPHLLARIRTEGHLVGNHSHRHRRPGQVWGVGRDLRRCQELIERHGGGRPRLYRPPFGRLTPATLLVPRALGLHVITWSLDVRDWACRTEATARQAGEELAGNATERDIVLLHDDTPAVLTVLDTALPALVRQFDLNRGVEELPV